ncbi:MULTISPECIES: hypothetical protein [Bacillus]|uniref:hypothetical protein n=1 Tax=Bacillus TaxID=1386 RepID=UPI0008FEA739|nr:MULTISPECIES: hypothetical protein [Bacillus]OJE32421.1 hypothetical protein BAQ44_22305 [Bacillus mobilis]HDR7243182.1 hypothetical protein [Bacillus mobilis]
MEAVYKKQIKDAMDDIKFFLETPYSYLLILDSNREQLYKLSFKNNMKEEGFDKLPEHDVEQFLMENREIFERHLDKTIDIHKKFIKNLGLHIEPKQSDDSIDKMFIMFDRIYDIIYAETVGDLEGGTLFSNDPNVIKYVDAVRGEVEILVEDMIRFTSVFKQYIDPQYE